MKPTKFEVWYMHDNYTFTELPSDAGLEAVALKAVEVRAKSPCGMLCSLILIGPDGSEVRRVGACVRDCPTSPDDGTRGSLTGSDSATKTRMYARSCKRGRRPNRATTDKEKKMTPAEAVARLYNHARPLGFGLSHYRREDIMSVREAESLLSVHDKGGYKPAFIDYLRGRVMKIWADSSISPYEWRFDLYDRDNGPNAAMDALTCPGCSLCRRERSG